MFMALIIAIHILTSRRWHWLLHPWKAGLSMLVCMVVIVLTLEILILRHLHWDCLLRGGLLAVSVVAPVFVYIKALLYTTRQPGKVPACLSPLIKKKNLLISTQFINYYTLLNS